MKFFVQFSQSLKISKKIFKALFWKTFSRMTLKMLDTIEHFCFSLKWWILTPKTIFLNFGPIFGKISPKNWRICRNEPTFLHENKQSYSFYFVVYKRAPKYSFILVLLTKNQNSCDIIRQFWSPTFGKLWRARVKLATDSCSANLNWLRNIKKPLGPFQKLKNVAQCN